MSFQIYFIKDYIDFSFWLKDLITRDNFDEIFNNRFDYHDIFENTLRKKCDEFINKIINENT
jgi:disulfide oxidoreductase YuzD